MTQKPVTLYLPDELLKEIELYKTESYSPTRNAAILQLIAIGLNQHKKGKGVRTNG